ncbi:DUF4044 domain-containing protein [Clostridium sp.]|nr:DUF4044 domain-containing protein [Clostridium sp.]MBK5234176.1 DUF4044 domain-containing protein [Clostridium sp.]
MKKKKREKYTKTLIYIVVIIFTLSFVLPMLFR